MRICISTAFSCAHEHSGLCHTVPAASSLPSLRAFSLSAVFLLLTPPWVLSPHLSVFMAPAAACLVLTARWEALLHGITSTLLLYHPQGKTTDALNLTLQYILLYIVRNLFSHNTSPDLYSNVLEDLGCGLNFFVALGSALCKHLKVFCSFNKHLLNIMCQALY